MSLALAAGARGGSPSVGGKVLLIGLAVSLGLHGMAMALFARTGPMPAAQIAAGAGGDENETLAAIEATFVDLSPPEIRLPTPQMALPLTAPVIEIPRVVLPDPVMLPPEPPKVPLPRPVAATPAPTEPVPPKPSPKPVPKRAKAPKPVAKTPVKPAPQFSESRAASRAAGAGAGVQAGTRGSDVQALVSSGRAQELLAKWGATIRSRVERRKRYPSGAGRASGAVTVAMTISRSGQLTTAKVAQSSGNAALDAAALAAVRNAGKFPPAPAGLDKASHGFTLVIQFAR